MGPWWRLMRADMPSLWAIPSGWWSPHQCAGSILEVMGYRSACLPVFSAITFHLLPLSAFNPLR
jgi:hypothetical protein